MLEQTPELGNAELNVDFTCDEPTGLELYTYAGKVIDRLRALGVERSERPIVDKDHEGILPGLRAGDYFDGRLPTVIRRLTWDQLSSLYSLFTNWFAYLRYQTSIIATERSEALRQKEFLWSMIRQQHKIDPDTRRKRTDQAMSDAARSDSRFIVANAKYEELNMLHQCMEGMTQVAEQDMKVISREITIQQQKTLLDIHEKSGKGFLPVMAGGRFYGSTTKPEEDTGGSVPTKATSPTPKAYPGRFNFPKKTG